MIEPAHEAGLFAYMGGICKRFESPLLAANGTADHVHLLLSQSKNVALSPLVMEIKRDSSKRMKEQGAAARRFGWQDGYSGFSIGRSNLEAVVRYITRQKEHHRRKTFKEELIELLENYEVEYDPRYIWA